MLFKHKKTQITDNFRDRLFLYFIYGVLTLLTVIILLPLIYVVAASFSDPQAVISGKVFFWPVKPTLRGYEAVLTYKPILIGFRNSLIYLVLGTTVNISMTMLAAYALSRKEFKASRFLSVLFMITMIVSGGIVPLYLLVNALHMDNTIWAMIIPNAISVWNLMIARTYIQNQIPNDLYEVAAIDGCTPFGYFWRVVLPLSKPIIAVLSLYYGVAQWNSYFNAMLFINNPNLEPLQIKLRQLLVLNTVDPTMITNVEQLIAKQGITDLLKFSTIVVASLPVLLIYPLVQKHFVKGMMIGSVKG